MINYNKNTSSDIFIKCHLLYFLTRISTLFFLSDIIIPFFLQRYVD